MGTADYRMGMLEAVSHLRRWADAHEAEADRTGVNQHATVQTLRRAADLLEERVK